MLRNGIHKPAAFAFAMIFSCTASAAQSLAVVETKPVTQPDPLGMQSLWQLTLGMLLVLGLIVGIAWLLKRSGRFQIAAGGGLRILGGLSMGSRERVVLLQVGETQLLLGVAPGRIQTLHVLDEPLGSAQVATAGGAGFSEQFGKLMNKGKTS